jgi:carbonic anhydrase
MQRLIQGIHHFREQGFRSNKDLYERLAKGQNPETLFITCSDSRINPAALTNTKPGELFVIRNAGNIVPAYSGSARREGHHRVRSQPLRRHRRPDESSVT